MCCSTLYLMDNLSLQPRSNVLYSTLPQHSALSNAWEALGLLNFLCRDASASVQPSARNPCSSRKASTIFRILSSNNYFVPVSSWMHVSALWRSSSVWSSFSFLSPRSTPPSHFRLTNSCRATLMSHASAFIQNRSCGWAFLCSLIALT